MQEAHKYLNTNVMGGRKFSFNKVNKNIFNSRYLKYQFVNSQTCKSEIFHENIKFADRK